MELFPEKGYQLRSGHALRMSARRAANYPWNKLSTLSTIVHAPWAWTGVFLRMSDAMDAMEKAPRE